MNWQRFIFNTALLLDELNPDGTGGGGTGKKEPVKAEPSPTGAVTLSQEQFQALMARLGSKPTEEPPKKVEEPTLADKAKLERETQEKAAGDTKSLESALNFSIRAPEWLKTNASLLPKTIEGIFAAAEKENYANAIEKANAIKVGVIQEFFSQQSNEDLLTGPQKTLLEEFKKLTKNVKQERASQIYDAVFEPTFEMLKRIKKAELVAKGHGDSTSTESAYTEKMKALSKAQFLRSK